MTAEEWIAFMKKETVEDDSLPFATAKEARTVKTVRTWYVNNKLMALVGADKWAEIAESVKELPEN